MSRRNRWDELRQDRLTRRPAPATSGPSSCSRSARRVFALGGQRRALREARCLSQAELPRRMGSTQPAIARLEAGRVASSLHTRDGWPPPSASSSSSPSQPPHDATAASCQAEHPAEGQAMRFRRRAASARKFTATLTCSFCARHQRQVKKLIAGPGVYICNECVDLCIEIIAQERPRA